MWHHHQEKTTDPEYAIPVGQYRVEIADVFQTVAREYGILRVVVERQRATVVPGIVELYANCLGNDRNHILDISLVTDIEDVWTG